MKATGFKCDVARLNFVVFTDVKMFPDSINSGRENWIQ
jgi:hypothetical protein